MDSRVTQTANVFPMRPVARMLRRYSARPFYISILIICSLAVLTLLAAKAETYHVERGTSYVRSGLLNSNLKPRFKDEEVF